MRAFGSSVPTSEIGPLDPAKGYEAIVRGLVHCLLVLGLGLALVNMAPRRSQAAAAAALIVMALDLAAANSSHVMTVEQALFEGQPALAQIIEEVEAKRDPPLPGPFRVHRMPQWNPLAWNVTTSTDRARDYVAWERDTIRSKYGINFGIQYTHTLSVAELYDHDWYFSGFFQMVIGPAVAKQLGALVGTRVIYFPRRAYDMWNTRYFVVAANANGWRDPPRASAAFRLASELLYPERGRFEGPNGEQESKNWMDTQDFELLRNEQEFPRAWVVHDARAIRSAEGGTSDPRARARTEILYERDPLWNDPALTLFDPRKVAWVSRADLAQILPRLSRQPPKENESVTVSYPNPQRAILDLALESTGLVILSDVDYPGWQLTVDGKPAPIFRVNILMRGALVSAGRHRLVYSFAPRSFQVGLVVSIVGMGAWVLLGVFCVFRPAHPLLAGVRS